MPLLTIANARSFYRLDGRDDRPVVMLSHSLGQDHTMWDAQAADFAAHFRVLRYDIRGHGASEATAGEYRVEQLGADVVAIADALGIDRFAFCGLSLGGMIGQWLAVHASGRVTAAVLANTSARPDAAGMEARRKAVLVGGMATVADTVMARFFSPRMLAENSPVVASSRRTLLATDPVGYAGCCAAVRDFDMTAHIRRIHRPILVVSGDRDVSLGWSGHNEILAREIPGAQVVRLAGAHLSNLEQPRSFSAAVLEFLLRREADVTEADVKEAGTRTRRAVLGNAHVDRAVASTTDFNRDFQDLLTRYAWGTIWTRPGLDIRTRRLLVLVMTTALGRWEEFRLHLRAGIEHGLEWRDVEEVLLQAAVYAGIPAANTAFHIAAEERAATR